jgi:osmoprotectant transport system permease protein
MELFKSVLVFLSQRLDVVLRLLLEHLWLVFISVTIAIAVSIVLGIIITYRTGLAATVLTICQVIMVIPSLAMLAFMVPLFGIGFTSGVIALILYSLLPIVRNTYSGIKEIDPAIIEAAKGMGMNEWRILFKIKLPMASPVIMAGIRSATVMVVGIGAIASYIGAGGLGEMIFQGISRTRPEMIIVGAFFVSIIAITFDLLLNWIERCMRVG